MRQHNDGSPRKAESVARRDDDALMTYCYSAVLKTSIEDFVYILSLTGANERRILYEFFRQDDKTAKSQMYSVHPRICGCVKINKRPVGYKQKSMWTWSILRKEADSYFFLAWAVAEELGCRFYIAHLPEEITRSVTKKSC